MRKAKLKLKDFFLAPAHFSALPVLLLLFKVPSFAIDEGVRSIVS